MKLFFFILLFAFSAWASEQEAPRNDLLTNYIAGLFGGAASIIAGQPFDYIKFQMQLSNRSFSSMVTEIASQRSSSLRPMFRGTIYPVFAEGIATGFLYSCYTVAKENLSCISFSHEDGVNEVAQVCIAGSLAGISYGLVQGPLEFMRMQKVANQSSFLESVRHVFIDRRAFMQGMNATLARNSMGMMAYFMTVENASGMNSFVVGGLAGSAFWALSYPLDVVKNTIQSQDYKSNQVYRSVGDCASHLYRQGGVKAFYRGFSACMVRSVPANVAQFTIYSAIKDSNKD